MHRSLKPHPQAKKVAPPAIPGDPNSLHYQQQHQPHQQIPLYRLGSSCTPGKQQQQIEDGLMMSIVSSPSIEEGGFNLPRESTVAIRIKDEITDYTTAMASSTSKQQACGPSQQIPSSPACPSVVGCSQPVFCATMREPLTHKAAVYYHQQLALQEDQGIDLTQSPGRDSPGSSSGSAGSGSRHSTASLDSGRASSYLTGVSGTSIRGSSGPLSSPRCSSVSSCSIGSVDRVSQRNDELIIDWLLEMKYEEYAQLFIAAGYDLPTIARMTPEDLTAIGIKNPHHRERIKQRIDKLQILDNLPHFVPGSIEEWLQLLRLEEYIQPLLDQNYKTVRDVTQVTWEDLEDIGIVKLGHQKKILLAIKRVKDIISGKWNPGGQNAYQQQQDYRKTWQNTVEMPSTPPTVVPTARVSWDDSKSYGGDAYYNCNNECCGLNDIVLIKVRQPRGKSLESLEDIHDNSTRSHLTFSHYTTTDYGHFAHPSQMQQHQQALQQQQQQQQALAANRLMNNPTGNMTWRRSYDDGDITPTNEAARELMYEDGGGTLPRQQRSNAVDRCKILQRAVLNSMPAVDHHYMNASAAEYICHAAVIGSGSSCTDGSSLTGPYLSGSPMASKKIAPEPPRRHCSIRNSRTLSAQQEQHAQQLSNNINNNSQQQQHQAIAVAHAQNAFYSAAAAAAASSGGSVGGGGGGVGVGGGSGGVGGGTGQLIHCNQTSYIPANMQSQQPIYANYATIQQTTAEIHCEKLHHDNKSNSSIDSIDTIPFANENTGTIKQRLLNRQDLPPQQHLSSSSSSSSSSTNTIANIAQSFHSLRSSSSLHDASLIRSDSIGSNVSSESGGGGGGIGGIAAISASHLRSPTFTYPPDSCSSSATAAATATDVHQYSPSSATPAAAISTSSTNDAASVGGGATVVSQNKTVSVNVLNDIGNMLANLTDELDAMLEEEKRVGLNIDSE